MRRCTFHFEACGQTLMIGLWSLSGAAVVRLAGRTVP